MIKGEKVELIPATLSDRQNIYEWCFHSETTKSHAGPPDYPDMPIPTYEEFCASDDGGYEEYYFTGARPEDGRGFVITHGSEPVGFISYCSFHLKPGKSELDIWMNSEAYCGNGLGVDAIASLCVYLNENLGIREMIMRPSPKNERAVRAYMKAGLEKSDKSLSYYLLDEYMSLYGDGDYGIGGDVLLVKRFEN